MRIVRLGVALAVVAVLFVVPQFGWAQSNVSSGFLYGTVTDQEGGALPGVNVEVKNNDTGFTRRAVSDESGAFRIDLVPSGDYDIKAQLSGFNTSIQRGAKVTLGSRVRIDFSLQLAAIEEEIVVTAEAPVVETTNPSITSTVGEEAIANLPLFGRDFTDFVALTPGAVTGGARGGYRIHMGARGIQNSFNIDGSNSQSSFFGEERGGTRPPFTFSQAAVKEFQVLKSSYNLQFSAIGGVINAITKSGTNEFHGEVFGYYRDDSYVEENAFGEEADDFEQRQYGFAFGGPVMRDELHFFTSFDGQDYETPTFRQFYDFPEDRDHAEWEALTGLDWDTETGVVMQTNDATVILAKLDWQLSDSNLLTLRDNWSEQEGENLTNSYRNAGRSNNGLEENSFNSFVANLASLVSENAFNELIIQYAAEERPRTANDTTIPEVSIYQSGYLATFGQNQFLPNSLDEERLQIIDNFTYYMGGHTLKVGANIDMVEFDNFFFRYAGGVYSYSGWEDFLDQEAPYYYRQSFSSTGGHSMFDTDYYAFYMQDEWRLSPDLTLTYGIRYDLQDHDEPSDTNPLYPDTGQIPDDDNNWAPRVGFAWDMNGDGKAVVRGGVGYFYDNTPTLLDANALLTNGVNVQRVTAYCNYVDYCPTFPNGWNSLGDLPAGTGLDIFVYDPNFENAETLRMSLGYEREVLTDFSVGMDLIYAETEKLERKHDVNLAPTGEYTDDGRPIYEAGTVYPELGQVMTFKSDARGHYKAAILKARKRYSDGWMFDTSYTYSKSRDQDSNERSVSSSGAYPEDQFDLGNEWGPSDFDVRHKFVVSGSYRLPAGFMISAIGVVRSGFPFSAMDGRDNNGDGYDRNERAVVELEDGSFYHYPRNSFNQRWFHNMDMRLSKAFSFGDSLELELIGEVFNVFDNENWYSSRQTLVDDNGEEYDNFNDPSSPGDPRQYQLGLKFRF